MTVGEYARGALPPSTLQDEGAQGPAVDRSL